MSEITQHIPLKMPKWKHLCSSPGTSILFNCPWRLPWSYHLQAETYLIGSYHSTISCLSIVLLRLHRKMCSQCYLLKKTSAGVNCWMGWWVIISSQSVENKVRNAFKDNEQGSMSSFWVKHLKNLPEGFHFTSSYSESSRTHFGRVCKMGDGRNDEISWGLALYYSEENSKSYRVKWKWGINTNVQSPELDFQTERSVHTCSCASRTVCPLGPWQKSQVTRSTVIVLNSAPSLHNQKQDFLSLHCKRGNREFVSAPVFLLPRTPLNYD